MKNINIECWRIIFTLTIILYHFHNHIYGSNIGGYIGVKFFFILSGFFLARSVERKVGDANMIAVGWIKGKLKRLYPQYILAFVLYLL